MSANPYEVELKRMLIGDGAAEKLITFLKARVRDEKRQINYIFDTADRALDRARYALRLRMEEGNAFLTAKGPSRNASASTITKMEAEIPLEAEEADSVLAGRSDPLSVLKRRATDPVFAELWRGLEQARGGRSLRSSGNFETIRRTVPVTLPHGLEVEMQFDRTTFPNHRVDHEVEIELRREDAAREVEAWLKAAALAAGVEMKDSTPKIARFFASKKRGSP